MGGVGTEIVLVLLLLVVNGVFAMSEIAVVSSRKARLQQRAEAGDVGARRALELAENPNRFLSTVQVGITMVGVLAGAFGGATIAAPFAETLRGYPAVAPYADGVALGVVVLAITYLSLIVGELVPKRIGLSHPERIAAAVAGPMNVLSRVSSPLVSLLTVSTEAVLRLLGIRRADEPPVTEAEISMLMQQGTQAGVFEEAEQDIVERVFWLGDQRVASLMTPRRRVVWLDADAPPATNREIMSRHRFSRFLVCEETLDRVVGMVEVKDLWARSLAGDPVDDLRSLLRKPLFVPESTRALRVLELFRESGTHLALVVDEYGGIEGLVTLNDLLEEIVGDLALAGAPASPGVVRRDDGSWLVDGALQMEEFREALGLPERREEDREEFRTVAGFVLTHMGRVPSPGDRFDAGGLRVEVVDMDAHRVDKVLVTPLEDEDGS
ncbi:MAG: hemolysin family protein [Longimicrobiaceae bacterium]